MDNVLFGLDTFGDVAYNDETNKRLTYEESLRMIVEEGKLADKLGIDVLALGEHHEKNTQFLAQIQC